MAAIVRGNKVAYYRVERGLSLRELSSLSGVDSGTINRLENGRSQPRAKTVRALCNALNVPVSELFDVDSDFRGGKEEDHAD